LIEKKKTIFDEYSILTIVNQNFDDKPQNVKILYVEVRSLSIFDTETTEENK